MAFDFRQLRRGLTKYLDYDIKKTALDRELGRRTREKQEEAERKLQLESDEAQRKSLLDLAKLDTPAGIEAQSRLLPGLNRAKSEQFLKAKTFLSPLLREKQYGTASTLGVGEFGETEEDKASAEAEKMLADARKEQANLAKARIGKVQFEIQKIKNDIKKQQDILKKGAGNLKELKEIYNVFSDEHSLLMETIDNNTKDPNLHQVEIDKINSDIREEIKKLNASRNWVIFLMKKYGLPIQQPPELPENVRSNIGPLTEQGQFNPAARPKLDY